MPVLGIVSLINSHKILAVRFDSIYLEVLVKNLTWFLIPSLAFALSLSADSPVIAQNTAIKASYDFNLNVEELNEAEARLKALESSLASKIDPTDKNQIPEKKQLAIIETKPEITVSKLNKPAEVDKQVKEEKIVAVVKNNIPLEEKKDLPVKETEILTPSVEEQLAALKNDHTKELELLRQTLLTQAEEENNKLKEEIKIQADQIAQITIANQAYKNIEEDLNQRFEKQVEKLGLKLMLAETEVERLAAMLEDQNRKVLGLKPLEREKINEEIVESKKVEKVKETVQNVDMPVVRVAVDKANLRTGPGMNHSPLMELAGGSRLFLAK
jgi:hypothetical protein